MHIYAHVHTQTHIHLGGEASKSGVKLRDAACLYILPEEFHPDGSEQMKALTGIGLPALSEYLTQQKQRSLFHNRDRPRGLLGYPDLKTKAAATVAATRPGLRRQGGHASHTNAHTYARVHVLPANTPICTATLKPQLT